jgi:protein-tyrosine-phosphatase
VARHAKEQLTSAAQAEGRIAKTVPELLFVCVHNAGRSQMAAALAEHLSARRVHVRSAGSAPAGEVNPVVIQVLAERGITLDAPYPKPLSDNVVRAADVIITMGCGDACPIFPGKRYEDWPVADPADQPTETVRDIRDDIQARSRPCCATSSTDQPHLTDIDEPALWHKETPYVMTTDQNTQAVRPSVLFVCVHNAGRSQMAAAYTRQLSGGAVEVRSAGSEPADQVNPAVREALLEEGIDISAEVPKILTTNAVQASDVIITMGCGDTCPIFPGKRHEDWVLDDPAGQGVDAVRPIRDEIKQRVRQLLASLDVRLVAR